MNIAFHTGKTAMIAQAQALNVYGNNIANINTYGYQTVRPSFADCLYSTQRATEADWQTGHGAYIQRTGVMFDESSFYYTERPLDFALPNEGFFAVEDRYGLDELYFLAKTKRYTLARIRRAVLCAFLGVDKKMLHEPDGYIRILGMHSRGREILSAAKNSGCTVPMDTSLRALMDASFEAHRLGAFQARCRDVWALALEKPLPCGSDFTAKPTILS